LRFFIYTNSRPSIKFFESIKTGSPNKRRKLEQPGHDAFDIMGHPSTIGQDCEQDHCQYEAEMPGFHEHEEDDVDISRGGIGEEDEDAVYGIDKILSRPRPPASAPARSNSRQESQQVGATVLSPTISVPQTIAKPVSFSHVVRSLELSSSRPNIFVTKRIPTEDLENTHPTKRTRATEPQCPVCGLTLQIDNQGLNTHIDFCLSRGAIREAQSEASNLTVTKKKGGRKELVKRTGV
jgi:DNA polymerase kappa